MIGVAVAWRLQVVVSAAHLALRGGLLFSRSLLRYARRRGVITWSEDETHIDEVVGYAVAAAGLGCQLSYGFALAFPWKLLLSLVPHFGQRFEASELFPQHRNLVPFRMWLGRGILITARGHQPDEGAHAPSAAARPPFPREGRFLLTGLRISRRANFPPLNPLSRPSRQASSGCRA